MKSPCLVLLAVLTGFWINFTAVAEAGRERILLDAGWRFHLGDAPDAGTNFNFTEVRDLAKTRVADLGNEVQPWVPTNDISFVRPKFYDRAWREVDLPHDWVVELPFDPKARPDQGSKPVGANFPQNSIGWYRRAFTLPKSDSDKQLWLDFDGVLRDSIVWLNGHYLGRHFSGYSSFRHDITQFANFGGKNELVVRVDASRVEGWFYEGAGIYRHVWLVKTSPINIAPDGIFVWSEFPSNVVWPATGLTNSPASPAEVRAQTQLGNSTGASAAVTLNQEIVDSHGKSVAKVSKAITLGSEAKDEEAFSVPFPELWSPKTPVLYRMVTTIESDGRILDRVQTEFGIRSVAFDSEKGFLLNGKPYTIKGTCNHQDHAGVGAALPDALQYFRVKKLKEMGVNAYRTSHNAPTPELLEACDRLGMLVMDENRRMDTNSQTLSNLTGQVLRDRNHPSVFIWSLGNEEHALEGSEPGERVMEVMQDAVHKLDPTRLCTTAMDRDWGKGFSKVEDVQGFNYNTAKIVPYHEDHPKQPEIGTETASTVSTRGIYTNDAKRGYVSAYGDEYPRWASKPWDWWQCYATNAFTSGGFIWTGFDYRGEPTPYKWPCINSHFGVMDTCGFPKDIYYYYQAWWTARPVLHIAPHWNWQGREGQTNLVRVFSNCEEVELFVNGKSLGKQTMAANSYLDWNVVYEPGVLSAKGYNDGALAMETKVETTGAPAGIQLSPDRSVITADGRDVGVFTVSVVDKRGRVVPVADNLIRFEVKGPGKIIGVGNGDPSSHEPDKASQRRVFNGLAEVIVQSDARAGVIKLSASSSGLHTGDARIQTKR